MSPKKNCKKSFRNLVQSFLLSLNSFQMENQKSMATFSLNEWKMHLVQWISWTIANGKGGPYLFASSSKMTREWEAMLNSTTYMWKDLILQWLKWSSDQFLLCMEKWRVYPYLNLLKDLDMYVICSIQKQSKLLKCWMDKTLKAVFSQWTGTWKSMKETNKIRLFSKAKNSRILLLISLEISLSKIYQKDAQTNNFKMLFQNMV